MKYRVVQWGTGFVGKLGLLTPFDLPLIPGRHNMR